MRGVFEPDGIALMLLVFDGYYDLDQVLKDITVTCQEIHQKAWGPKVIHAVRIGRGQAEVLVTLTEDELTAFLLAFRRFDSRSYLKDVYSFEAERVSQTVLPIGGWL